VLLTSAQDGAALAFARIRLAGAGTYALLGEWIYAGAADLGVPQGLEWRNGTVWYLTDAGATTRDDPHILYKLDLPMDGGEPAVLDEYHISMDAETQEMALMPDGTLYFATAEERIYRLDATVDDLPGPRSDVLR
jgi:hypothetical protein